VRLAAEHDIPIGPNYATASELTEDDHFRGRGVFVEDDHPRAGPFTYTGRASVLRGEPGYRVRRPAPTVGEHTGELLTELGYTSEQIAAFRQREVV
jgi:formyl-CoA transferase